MKNTSLKIIGTLVTALLFSSCLKKDVSPAMVMHPQVTIGTGNPADAIGVPGVPGATVPTGPAIIARIQNALENNANPLAGNFLNAINQLGSNLPKLSNPLKSTGADQVSLLAYAACSDVSANLYSVNIGSTIALQKTNIVNAGKRILDRCTAGLATTSAAGAEVTAALTELADKNAAVSGETTEMAWISSCYTAVTVCTQFLGI